ncbi:hypothetical protein [Cribrihabitans marinus]|uniref:hypothetical protein n=1 Tax=Cribrihabitans marinus TaxID=1227549 RepID=UPI000B836497|nr:hypothetical protein [Cribrihabitans marinus]
MRAALTERPWRDFVGAVLLVLYVTFSAMATAGTEAVPGDHQDHATAEYLDGSAPAATSGHDLPESHCHSGLDCFLIAILAPEPMFRMSQLVQRTRKIWPEERPGSITFSPRTPPPRPSAEA